MTAPGGIWKKRINQKFNNNESNGITVFPVETTRLDNSPVKVKVHMATFLDLSLNQSICVEHVYEIRIWRIQFLTDRYSDEERQRRIQASYSGQCKGLNGFGDIVRHLSPQGKSDYVNVFRSGFQNSVHQLSNAGAHVFDVVDCRYVTRSLRQHAVVNEEEVVGGPLEVFWKGKENKLWIRI